MQPERGKRLTEIHTQLIKLAQAWAGKRGFDAATARDLRREAILILHDHYRESIPVYQKLAADAGITAVKDLDPIRRNLMSTDDLFKSYRQEWLNDGDFTRMNQWLSTIFHRRLEFDVSGVRTIDDWIDRLAAQGVILAYSSGTTGSFSFVPRDQPSWRLFTTAPVCYLAPILMDKGLGTWVQRLLIGPAAKILPPDAFARAVKWMGLPDYDGVFLNFRKGNMGIQLVAQEFAPLFRRSTFLYDIDLSASALRLITRGARSEEDRKLLAAFHAGAIGKKEENYAKIIRELKGSTSRGQKVFMFGAPYQLKELVEIVSAGSGKIALKEGSFILFGGGWKTFEGEKIEKEALVGMIAETFAVPSSLITEGYSMTEINATLPCCDQGRFHLPPNIEPVILDEALEPQAGQDLRGAFGFLDPFALSYPGFVISGDNVRMKDETCPCGMEGPALTEVGRAPGREIKGCGGIMASVQA